MDQSQAVDRVRQHVDVAQFASLPFVPLDVDVAKRNQVKLP
jgi:hypothetical protein